MIRKIVGRPKLLRFLALLLRRSRWMTVRAVLHSFCAGSPHPPRLSWFGLTGPSGYPPHKVANDPPVRLENGSGKEWRPGTTEKDCDGLWR